MINRPKEQAPSSSCGLTLCDIVLPFVLLRTDWSLDIHLWHMHVTAKSSMFYSANATDSPQIICLFDMWEPDTQTVSKSIKPQHWWQIEVTLNYDCCSEVITHRALAKMLWRSSVAISLLWRADLDPSPSPRWTTVKSSRGWDGALACLGEKSFYKEIRKWIIKEIATKYGIGDIKTTVTLITCRAPTGTYPDAHTHILAMNLKLMRSSLLLMLHHGAVKHWVTLLCFGALPTHYMGTVAMRTYLVSVNGQGCSAGNDARGSHKWL